MTKSQPINIEDQARIAYKEYATVLTQKRNHQTALHSGVPKRKKDKYLPVWAHILIEEKNKESAWNAIARKLTREQSAKLWVELEV